MYLSLNFPDTVLNFIRSHPLMDAAVAHHNDKPVYYKRDLLFTHLVVDRLKYDIFDNKMEYVVYYAGTSKCTRSVTLLS